MIEITQTIIKTSPSGNIIPSGIWTSDCSPYIRIIEPSGELLRGYSISIVNPGDDDSLEPDLDEITNNPGGAWLLGGEQLTWNEEYAGWDEGRWNHPSGARNYWDIEQSGLPPSGVNITNP